MRCHPIIPNLFWLCPTKRLGPVVFLCQPLCSYYSEHTLTRVKSWDRSTEFVSRRGKVAISVWDSSQLIADSLERCSSPFFNVTARFFLLFFVFFLLVVSSRAVSGCWRWSTGCCRCCRRPAGRPWPAPSRWPSATPTCGPRCAGTVSPWTSAPPWAASSVRWVYLFATKTKTGKDALGWGRPRNAGPWLVSSSSVDQSASLASMTGSFFFLHLWWKGWRRDAPRRRSRSTGRPARLGQLQRTPRIYRYRNFTEFYLVLPSFIQFYLLLPSFIQFLHRYHNFT